MAVSNRTIIQKMTSELELAKASQHDMTKHIAHVKLLCELLLEEEGLSAASKTDVSAKEMKAMMGVTGHPSSEEKQADRSNMDNDDANGKSIFDF